jgi:hypothetical protein
MWTIVTSVLVALGVLIGVKLKFDFLSGIILGVIAGAATFILLLRRGRKRLEAAMKEIEGHMKAQRLDKAVTHLEALRPMARWQPGLGGSVEGQIGMIKYAHMREFEGARPHLEKAHPKLWQAWAMLGASHFKKDRFAEMHDVFEKAVKHNKGEALLWLVYGWCEWKRNRRTEAIEILARGQKACPSDDRIKHQLNGLQNGKKMKMKMDDPEWVALHLDRTIPVGPGGPGGQQRPRFMPPARRIGVRHMRG